MQIRYSRLPFLLLSILALLFALWAGLLRMGWAWPVLRPMLPMSHGPLMVSGFFGTLIALERAVATNRRWAYLSPLCSGVGGALLIAGLHGRFPALLLMLGGLGLALICLWMWRQHRVLHTAIIAVGALCWLAGSVQWLLGAPVYQVVLWWSAFFIFTISGERLELSRVRHLKPGSRRLFTAISAGILMGLVWSGLNLIWGERVVGLGYLALAGWLLVHDLARVTVRQSGLTRYIALCLLSGFVWLGVGGLLGLLFPGYTAGPIYDAKLHSVFVGFVFGMVFGHALIIFPAVLGVPITYRSTYYIPLVALQLSLILRLVGDFTGWVAVRQWGGLLNALTIVLFLLLIVLNTLRRK